MEEFKVDPQELEGCARLLGTVGDSLRVTGLHIAHWASGAEGFTGLMELIKPPVEAYANSQESMLEGWQTTLRAASENTTNAAWIYLNCDTNTTGNFNTDKGYPGDGLQGAHTPIPGAVSYNGADRYTSFSDPAGEDADMSDVIDEVGGPLAAIDDVVGWVTDLFGEEWRPVTEVLEPIAGNWGALERAGSALKDSGLEMKTLQTNLDLGRMRVANHWDGQAAQAFDPYVTAFVKAIEDDGVLNRIIGEVYALVAPQIRGVAGTIVEQLNWLVEQIAQQIAAAWIPVAGQIKAAKWLWDTWYKVEEIMDLIERIRNLIETVKTLVEFAQDPIGAAQGYLEEKLSPVTEGLDRGQELATLLADSTSLTSMDIGDAPTEAPSYTNGAADGR